MPNNGWKPSFCRSCKRKATARHPVSFRGLCQPCAEKAVTENITQLATKRGEKYDRWAENLGRALDAIRSQTG